MRPFDPRLLGYARTTRQYLLASAGLGVLGVVAIIAQASLLASAITRVFLDGAGLAELRGPLLALAGVVAARGFVVWAQEATARRSSALVKGELRGRLMAHVVRLGPAWLHGERSGEVTTLLTRGLDALDTYFARYLPQLVLSALVPAAVLIWVLPVDLVAGLTIAVTLPLIPVFMALVGSTTEQLNRRQFGLLSRLSHHLLELISGLATLKVFNRAKAQAKAIRALTDEQRRLTMRTLRLAFLSSLVLELLATLSVALVAVGIGLRVVGGSLDLRTA
ncbi:MAG TPA: ABC transporter transmembrane domain-containing protein, partial [Micromonosporaceae bacterium]